jgi:hypothetical protein
MSRFKAGGEMMPSPLSVRVPDLAFQDKRKMEEWECCTA